MKLLKYVFLISLLLFAWSVCLTMFNMSAEEEFSIMGIPSSYFMIPLLLSNLIIILSRGTAFPRGGISSVILAWLILVSFITAIHTTRATDLIKVTLWPTTYFASYILCAKNMDYNKSLRIVFAIIFLMGAFYFVWGKLLQNNIFSQGLMSGSNTVFCVITVLPFLLLSKNRYVAIIAIIITFLCVVFSNKRSVTLAFAVALLPTLNSLFGGIKSKGKRVFVIVALSTAAVVIFYYLVNHYLGGRIFERFQGIEEDGGSGRVEIWTYVLNAFQDSDFISQLFGHGHYAVSGLGNATAAHNDFLEVLYDYGIIVFIVYLLLHRSIIKKVLLLRRLQSPLFASYFFFAVIFIVMSWISILIPQQRYIIYMAVLMAYIEVEINNNCQL